jgi:hypothetical protein
MYLYVARAVINRFTCDHTEGVLTSRYGRNVLQVHTLWVRTPHAPASYHTLDLSRTQAYSASGSPSLVALYGTTVTHVEIYYAQSDVS